MSSKILACVVTTVLSCSVVQAAPTDSGIRKEGRVGMLGGAAAGALVGGPIGAAVGFFFGGVVGDSIGIAKQADRRAAQAETRLASAQEELAAARIELAQASKDGAADPMLTELAERLRADVMFRTGSAELEADVASRLSDLGRMLAAKPGLEIEIHGFADPRGSKSFNLELSRHRSDAVQAALAQGGVNIDRIHLNAHGKEMSTATVGDVEAYAWERRVSVAITARSASVVAQAK